MWVPTRQDAVAIYARFCLAHYGYNALFKAEQQAARLAQLGDGDGKKIWDEVASEIKKWPMFATLHRKIGNSHDH